MIFSAKCAKIKVINTFASDKLKLEGVKQLQFDSSKKVIITAFKNIDLIIDAANVMFNQDSTPVTVRMAQSGDKVISTSAVLPKQEIETSSPATNLIKSAVKLSSPPP